MATGLVALVVAGSLPWWLPPAIVRAARGYGINVGAWRSEGWSTIEYRDVGFTSPGVVVTADSVKLPRFLLQPAGPAPGADTPVVIGSARVELKPQPRRPEAPEPATSAIVAQVDALWGTLRRWLPEARAREITLVSGSLTLELRDVQWRRDALAGTVAVPERGIEAVVSIDRSGPRAFLLRADLAERRGAADLEIAPRPDGGTTLSGTVTWRDMPVEVGAVFSAAGMVPAEATVRAAALSVPASDLRLEGYGPVEGSLDARWARDVYEITIAAHAAPSPGSSWPAAQADVRVSGDLERMRIERVELRLPGLQAALSQPLDVMLDGRAPAGSATFSVDADLGALPWLGARGRIGGTATVQPDDSGRAAVDLDVHGEGLGWRELEGASLSVIARWRQPEIVLERATLELGPDARSELRLRWDTARRILQGGSLRAVIPSALLRAISTELPPCDRIELEAEADGPWEQVRHRGQAVVHGLEWTPGRRIGGTVAWAGEGTGASVEGEVALAGGGALPFAFQAEQEPDGSIVGTIANVRWTDESGEWWRLEEAVPGRYEPGTGELALGPWNIVGDGFQLAGDARVRWPAVGNVSLVLTGLEGARIGGVLPEPIRAGRIERLNLNAAWDHGPARIDGSLRAIYAPVPGTEYAVESEFVTREAALAFGSVQVQDASGVVLRGAGRLPLLVEGTDEGFRLELRRDDPIQLELASEPNPVFWQSIADLTGWTIGEPRLACRLEGSIAAPRGELQVAADTLRPPSILLANGGQLPELTGLAARIVADDAGLSIVESMVAIDYRWVTLSGLAPWPVWRKWRETGEIDWRRASFKLATNPLPIAIASRVFPTELAPEGEASVGIAHEPEVGLSGRIWLHDAASRPLGPLGPVRAVNSEMDFAGYQVALTRLEGLLGGQPVRVTGEANLLDPKHNEFSLHVRSSRVPLVRRSGLIIRTEVDLNLEQDASGPARVTGRVDFGPSVFSADLLQLIPTGVDQPEKRPPYFSIEEQPFSAWQIDVAVHGEAFLQVNTPFYRDLLSTDARLTGTLGEPRVEGWVWGSGGVVTFPFGRIPVEQVLVTLSRENPFEPQLVMSGSGRVMGYDIRMEASGPASEPRLLFTSDPPLSSQQVFMMLSTGAVPDDPRSNGSTGRASRLAFFLGRNLAAGLGLGGNGGEERLDVRSGEDFTREGRETVVVEYDLDGRWSLVGEYDRFDAYNGGIKFRLIRR